MTAAFLLTGCGGNPLSEPIVIPIALKDVASSRLSYRYEPDVPAPDPKSLPAIAKFERNEAVQLDFDTNRPTEILERTLPSPGGERILAVYRKGEDLISSFRLDMYSKDGKLLRKVTHDEMAVQFPGTIVWSPDGNNVAFVAKVRSADDAKLADLKAMPDATPEVVDRDGEEKTESAGVDAAASPETGTEVAGTEASKDVLTFRTEQIYTCAADGGDVKPLTKVEGLMYFYFVWAPDSGALAALATIHTEWQYFETRSKEAGQVFVPRGRPRLIEKNGRERLLDDFPTAVHPVWSPDSAKVAVAFDKQIRIYDGVRNQPTQAAIQLKNDLLISSRKYEEKLKLEGGDKTEGNNAVLEQKKEAAEKSNSNTTTTQAESALPDANLLVSFNPIVNLVWPEDKMLYLETGFVRNYLDETESVRSYMRWHRLVLSAQAVTLSTTQQPQ